MSSVTLNNALRVLSIFCVVGLAMLQYVVNNGVDLGLTKAQTGLAGMVVVGLGALIAALPRAQGDGMDHERRQLDATAQRHHEP